jgi:hypothetical protein
MTGSSPPGVLVTRNTSISIYLLSDYFKHFLYLLYSIFLSNLLIFIYLVIYLFINFHLIIYFYLVILFFLCGFNYHLYFY